MNKEKQIEEMARVMNECCNRYDAQGNHLGNKCFECECWCDTNHICCSYNTKEATALYDAGYRKASDVAREIFAEIEEIAMHSITSFGLQTMVMGEVAFAELKKKYIGEDTNVTTKESEKEE
jgi:hypothetical protein